MNVEPLVAASLMLPAVIEPELGTAPFAVAMGRLGVGMGLVVPQPAKLPARSRGAPAAAARPPGTAVT
jgi:hypothetical protein